MERTAWTDDRLDDAYNQLRHEMRAGFADLRAEMRAGFADVRAETRDGLREVRGQIATLKLFMLGGLVTILAAVVALHG